jgi:hypothetical protein
VRISCLGFAAGKVGALSVTAMVDVKVFWWENPSVDVRCRVGVHIDKESLGRELQKAAVSERAQVKQQDSAPKVNESET